MVTSIDDKSVNGRLGDYDMGDYGKDTKFTNESNSVRYNNFNTKGGISEVDNGIRVINGRILAAFPAALKREYDNAYNTSNNSMHLARHYKLPNKWENNQHSIISQKDGGSFGDSTSAIFLSGNDMYKLVDCVFEAEGGRQFVVPFIAIDAKLTHLLPNMYDVNEYLLDKMSRGGMMANLTDNRYGQVIEYTNNLNPKKYEYNIVTSKTNSTDEQLIKREQFLMFDYETEYYDDKGKRITYFDKEEPRSVESMSPIEPLTTRTLSSKEMMQTIFGDTGNYKLISMRIYKDEGMYQNQKLSIRIANNDGVPYGNEIAGNMWSSKREEIAQNTNAAINSEDGFDSYIEENYNDIVVYDERQE